MTMNLINQFGRMVSSESLKDPEKARRLLLMGYRLQEKRLKFFPDKNLPDSAHYEKYYSCTCPTGKCSYGQHFCSGRTADRSGADPLFSGGVILLSCRYKV